MPSISFDVSIGRLIEVEERRRTSFAPKCQRIVVYKTDLQLLRMLMKPGLLWPERDNRTSASELEKNQLQTCSTGCF